MNDFLRDFPDTEDDIPFASDEEAKRFIRRYAGRFVVASSQAAPEPPREIIFVDDEGNDIFAQIRERNSKEEPAAE